MTWTDFYAGCFLVGFLLSAASFLMGEGHAHHGGNSHFGDGHGHAHASHHNGHGEGISFFNLATASAFLAWFGGVGFIVTRYSSMWAWFGLAIAVAGGLVAASVVFVFVAKVLVASERDLDPADYEMIGALGRVSSPVREGGTGEMLFSQQGARRSVAVRSEDGAGIDKGTEVVVTRYEKGIAYVRRWEDLAE